MRLTHSCRVAHRATATDWAVNFNGSFIAESFFPAAWPHQQRAQRCEFRFSRL